MGEPDGRVHFKQALLRLRTAAKHLSVQKIANEATAILKLDHERQRHQDRARQSHGLAGSGEPPLQVSRSALNGWLNEGKLPKWEQLWAVVRVLAEHSDNRNLSELEAEWRELYRRTAAIPQTAQQTVTTQRTLQIGRIPLMPDHFVDRAPLHELREAVGDHAVVVVVTGMRGIGKTQLAASYARDLVKFGKTTYVGWIDAETDGTLLEGLHAIAKHFCVADPNGDSTVSARQLRDHLSNLETPGLLIFDNSTDPDRISEFIPNQSGTKVVITTTNRDFVSLGSPLDLGGYERGESIKFLCDAAKLDDRLGANRIAEVFGDLPLALTQAAATITFQRLNFQEYENLLNSRLAEAVTRLSGESHHLRVDQAILLSIESTESTSENPALDIVVHELLNLMAMLSPTGVNRRLLPLYGGQINAAIARCVRGSLLTWSDDGSTVIMHRLIARVLRERAQAMNEKWALLNDTLASITEMATPLFEETDGWKQRDDRLNMVDHIDAITATGIPAALPGGTAAMLAHRAWACGQLRIVSDTERAINQAEKTLSDCMEIFGPTDEYTLAVRTILADAYQEAGRFAQSVPLYEFNLTVWRETLGNEHEKVLFSAHRLARSYFELGQFDDALDLCIQNLTNAENAYGPNHRTTILMRENLASGYKAAGQFESAIPAQERSVLDHKSFYGPEHSRTLTARHNLADTYRAAGRLRDAISMFEQGLLDTQRIHGSDHPATLSAKGSLGEAYWVAGRLDLAIPMLQETLSDRVRILGPFHPSILFARNSLAGALHSAGKSTEAADLYSQNLDTFRGAFGLDHPYILATYNNIGGLHLEVELLTEAIAIFEVIVPLISQRFGLQHPQTLTVRNNLASAYQKSRRYPEAVSIFEVNLTDTVNAVGNRHPDSLRARNNLASAYQDMGRLTEALALYRYNLNAYAQIEGKDHPATLTARNNLAHNYMAMHRFVEAIALYEQNFVDTIRVFGRDHRTAGIAHDNLVDAYKAVNRHDDPNLLLERPGDEKGRHS